MNVPVRWRGAPAMALASLFFAAMATVARAASATLSAGQLVAGRFLIGIVVVLVIFTVSRTRPRIQRPWLWVQRGVLGGAAVYCWFYAIEHVAVGPATLLNFTSPIYAALFGAFFLKEKSRPRLWIGLLGATVGAALVLLEAADRGTHLQLSLGLVAGILSGVLSGAAHTTVVALRQDTDATTVFFSFSVVGFLFVLPFAVATWKPVNVRDVFILLLVGGLAAAGQLLMTYAYGFLTASGGSVWIQLTPAATWGLAVVLLHERLTARAAVGALITVAAILFATGVVGHKRTAISSEPPTSQ